MTGIIHTSELVKDYGRRRGLAGCVRLAGWRKVGLTSWRWRSTMAGDAPTPALHRPRAA